MEILATIGLVVLGLVLVIGLIRVTFSPFTGIGNLILECLLIDVLIDGIGIIIGTIGDIWD